MGEVRTIFKLETSQFDSKLQDASKSLASFTEWAQKMGNSLKTVKGDFSGLSQKNVEVARSFGQITSGATTLKDKLKDLVTSYNQVASAYNKLTSEQQKSDFGKAMSESLSELEQRIKQTKTELYSAKESIGGFTDALDKLAGKFGLNLKQLTGWGAVISGVTAALKVTKAAFLASETNVDEWGRTVEAAESVYNSFLQTLNNGDFSGFLSRIQDVITKARDAYGALDELQTRGGIVNSERLRIQARQTELKAIIRRQGADSDAGKAAQTELKQLEGQLSKAYKTEENLNYNAFRQKVDERLQEAGINLNKKSYDFLMRSFSDDAVFETLKRNANGAKSPGRDTYTVDSSNPLNLKKVDTRNTEQKLLDLFTDEWRKEYKPLLDASFSARNSAASSMLGDARYLREGSSSGGGRYGGGGGGAAVKPLNIKLPKTDFTTNLYAPNEIANNWRESLAGVVDDFYNNIKAKRAFMVNTFAELNGIDLLLDIDETSTNAQLQEAIDEINLYMGDHPIKLNFATGDLENADNLATIGKNTKEAWKEAAQAVQSVGSAFAQIEDPAVKAVGTVTQAIASIAFGFAQAASAKDTTSSGWAWLGWLAAGATAMATTISMIHSLTGYAEGGMVKGNSYSGDNILATNGSQLIGLNAGEIVLNRAQSANIAGQLQNSGNAEIGGLPYTTGEKIVMGVNNWGRRNGKGELVFSRG